MVHFIPSDQRRLAMSAALSDPDPVLISGASGTGKSAMGKWIHLNSPRSTKSLMTYVNNKALAEQLYAAQGGAFFIPEITNIPLGEQKQLYDFIKTRSLPHPENPGLKALINVRIIAGTEHDLNNRAQAGMFNAELLARFKANHLEMPRLSDRLEEFEDITDELLKEITRETHKNHIQEISPAALDILKSYDWPANLRELRNTLRMAVVHAEGDTIEASDIPDLNSRKMDLRATREEFEKIYLVELFKTFDWDLEKVGKNIQMERSVLLEKAKRHGILAPAHNKA